MDHLLESWLTLDEIFSSKRKAYYGASQDFNNFILRDENQNLSFFLDVEKAVQRARTLKGKLIVVRLQTKKIKDLTGTRPTTNHNSRKELIKQGFDSYIDKKNNIVGVISPEQIEIVEIEDF